MFAGAYDGFGLAGQQAGRGCTALRFCIGVHNSCASTAGMLTVYKLFPPITVF